jgi:hypothetical protein
MEALATHEIDSQVASPVSAGADMDLSAAPKKNGLITFLKKKSVLTPDASEPAVDADVIGDLVHEIENLKKPDALAKLGALDAAREQSYFEIGGVLSVIQKSGWFEPYPSFDKWVETVVGMRRGKARALIRNYEVIANAGISAARFKKIEWTKLRTLAPVLTHENAEHWSNLAAEHTRAELQLLVKQSAASPGGAKPDSSTAAHIWIFKLHDDQNEAVTAAIDKAKKASGAEYDSTALGYICLDFLGANTLADRMKKVGVKSSLKALEDAFPEINFEIAASEPSAAAASAA